MTCAGKLKGDLAHEVSVPTIDEGIDQFVDDDRDEALLPMCEHLGTKTGGDHGAGNAVLRLVHLQDGPAHHLPHHAFVDARGIGLAVPQDLDHLVESEHSDGGRTGRVDGRRAVSEVDGPTVDRRLPAQLVHPRVRVADITGDHVLELEGIERNAGGGRALRDGHKGPLVQAVSRAPAVSKM